MSPTVMKETRAAVAGLTPFPTTPLADAVRGYLANPIGVLGKENPWRSDWVSDGWTKLPGVTAGVEARALITASEMRTGDLTLACKLELRNLFGRVLPSTILVPAGRVATAGVAGL